MTNEVKKQPIPTKEECLAFYKELTNHADARFVPYYNMAIKALKQETILDKVREEIKALSPEPTFYDVIETLADVLQIIDKYKAESEEDE